MKMKKQEIAIGISQAFGFGVFCLAAEYFLMDVTLTPFFSLCFLMWTATRRSSAMVFFSACVLLGFVILSLREQTWGNTILRIGSFCVGSSLAIAYSQARQRSLHALATARSIIQSLPMPIVAADSTGTIVSVSDNLMKLVFADFYPVVGHSFPDVFMKNLPPGEAMRQFFNMFQSKAHFPEGLYLGPGGKVLLPAKFQITGFGQDRLLIACVAGESVPLT
jgi:hypothetical protein